MVRPLTSSIALHVRSPMARPSARRRQEMRTAVLAACLCLFTTVAAAQEQRGSIEGVIKDSSGAVLPGVTVEARSPALVGVQSAVTDVQGVYRFPALAPGKYTIDAKLTGFRSARAENVAVELG